MAVSLLTDFDRFLKKCADKVVYGLPELRQ